MKINHAKFFYTLAVLVALFVVNGAIMAWTSPTENPTAGNVPGPINVGSFTQAKDGALGVKGIFEAYSEAIVDKKFKFMGGNPGANKILASINNDGEAAWKTAAELGLTGGGGGGGKDTRCDTSGTCSQVCIGTDCKSFWPSGGGGGGWQDVSPTDKNAFDLKCEYRWYNTQADCYYPNGFNINNPNSVPKSYQNAVRVYYATDVTTTYIQTVFPSNIGVYPAGGLEGSYIWYNDKEHTVATCGGNTAPGIRIQKRCQ